MIAAYCGDQDTCYLLPIERFDGRSAIQLRLTPAQNNQRLLINWASDYSFEATLAAPGAVAQLGERRDGIAEARGSSPLGSTHRTALRLVDG
jgi:hypothetical protein